MVGVSEFRVSALLFFPSHTPPRATIIHPDTPYRTDKHVAQITDKDYWVESFAHTIDTQLDIDPDHKFQTTDDRPIKIILEDRPRIKESLA